MIKLKSNCSKRRSLGCQGRWMALRLAGEQYFQVPLPICINPFLSRALLYPVFANCCSIHPNDLKGQSDWTGPILLSPDQSTGLPQPKSISQSLQCSLSGQKQSTRSSSLHTPTRHFACSLPAPFTATPCLLAQALVSRTPHSKFSPYWMSSRIALSQLFLDAGGIPQHGAFQNSYRFWYPAPLDLSHKSSSPLHSQNPFVPQALLLGLYNPAGAVVWSELPCLKRTASFFSSSLSLFQ